VRTVFLDANVLYPAFLRDVLLRLAFEGLFQPCWSDRVQEEWMRSLLARRPDLTRERLMHTRRQMERAFPGASVGEATSSDDMKHADVPSLPDPDDDHVLLSALEAGASHIATFNLRDFPTDVLGPLGVQAVHPDDLLRSFLQEHTQRTLGVIRSHRALLQRPPLSPQGYVRLFINAGLTESASILTHHTGDL
jgi:hypothetical protein